MYTKKDIARHFELCEEHYRNWWDLKKSRSMHYGYWDDTTHSLHDALMNINKVMSQKAGITPTHHVLDAGCGVGGSSLWLARNIGCAVIGITLSEKQQKKAQEYAVTQELSGKANFLQADYTDTGLTGETFDVVWAIESVCYAENKSTFLKEAYRLLKPGGVLIVADFFKTRNQADEKGLMEQMARGWAVNDFATIEDFRDDAEEAGFNNIQTDDISGPITPSARRLYVYSFPGMLLTKLYCLFNDATELSKHHAKTIHVQYVALKKGLWKYQLFLARK